MNIRTDPNGLMVNFLDGPMAAELGGPGRLRLPAEIAEWPLPDRLCAMVDDDAKQPCMLWDPTGIQDDQPDQEMRIGRQVLYYRKFGQSNLPYGTERVMRAASYVLEESDD